MSLKQEERAIGNYTYRVTQLPSAKGLEVLAKLLEVLSGPLAALIPSLLGKGVENAKATLASLAPLALSRLVEELGPRIKYADLKWLCETFGGRTLLVTFDGKPPKSLTLEVQQHHFAGRYGSLFKYLGFCLEMNFRGFTGGEDEQVDDAPPPETETE